MIQENLLIKLSPSVFISTVNFMTYIRNPRIAN